MGYNNIYLLENLTSLLKESRAKIPSLGQIIVSVKKPRHEKLFFSLLFFLLPNNSSNF